MLRLHERIRALPQITIGKLRGLARGGGAELLSAGAQTRAGERRLEALVDGLG
ncbi:enoyl-CoA hydratase/carnithine racemase [Crossiella equi]|uniref:Enoyl-CoA hydratase/carnithine racemase n=1 Tax=Crossiella equi TaxID=130796 RepID=A0ABS5A5M2_9PSEU|nr:hypothetical protein [Crossiella equi]MBP2471888.1 enoyl-CoA hydratase/carnithine racemase [Crossiella equi]